jgi:uncharacterized protein (TIRG00374 family)
MHETASDTAPANGIVARRQVARGLRLFVLLAGAAGAVVLALTVNRETLAGLAGIRWLWLAATVALWLTAVLIDGFRLAVLSRAGDHPLTFGRAVSVIYIGYFMAAVTPFQVGGLPLQLYLMNGWGASPGKASALLLLRGTLFYGVLFAAAPFVAGLLGARALLLQVLGTYIGLAVCVGGLLVLAGLAFPAWFAAWRTRLSLRPQPGQVRRLLLWLLAQLEGLGTGLRMYFHRNKLKYLIAGAGLTVCFMASVFGMSATLLAGLGQHADPLRTMGLNLLLCSVMLFVPTPGATGVAEAGAAGLYSMVCPKYMLGAYVLLWRVFSFYLNAAVGGLLTFRHLSVRSGSDTLHARTRQLEAE